MRAKSLRWFADMYKQTIDASDKRIDNSDVTITLSEKRRSKKN